MMFHLLIYQSKYSQPMSEELPVADDFLLIFVADDTCYNVNV